MNEKDALKASFDRAHQLLDGTIADCTPDVLSHKPPCATIAPIGAIYAHVVVSEDILVNEVAGGGTTVIAGDRWGQKLGISDPVPFQTPGAVSLIADLTAFREYLKLVLDSAHRFIEAATDEDLRRMVDTPLGQMPVGTFVATIPATHIPMHMGEIAALKGIQGLKGFQF